MAWQQITGLYNGACDMFIRPQRAQYEDKHLGPTSFKICGEEHIRENLTLKNERGLTLHCSHFYKKSFKYNSALNNLPSLPIKQLKQLLIEKKCDPSQFLEKAEMIERIKQLYELPQQNNNNNNENIDDESHKEETKMPCIIYLHGNSGCRLDGLDSVVLALSYNFSLFVVDLSGSGKSEGDFISLGYYEKQDVKAIINYLKTLPFVGDIGNNFNIIYST